MLRVGRRATSPRFCPANSSSAVDLQGDTFAIPWAATNERQSHNPGPGSVLVHFVAKTSETVQELAL